MVTLVESRVAWLRPSDMSTLEKGGLGNLVRYSRMRSAWREAHTVRGGSAPTGRWRGGRPCVCMCDPCCHLLPGVRPPELLLYFQLLYLCTSPLYFP